MFDIGWGELVLIGLVALIVIGPKELPTVLRTAGQWVGKLKRMASEFQGQFQEALREAEVADLKQHAEDLSSELKSIAEFDPLADTAKAEAATSDWNEPPFETPEHEMPAIAAAEAQPEPVAVAAVEAAPLEQLPAVEPPPEPAKIEDKAAELTPAETPPPKQAGGTA